MDHAYWPFVTTKLYLNQTGDLDILDQKVAYFKDRRQSVELPGTQSGHRHMGCARKM